MKIGYRKPSIKKSIKARTTGRAKRALNSSVNPLYGKKGTGLITNPKKSVYNNVYNKTTVSALPKAPSANKSNHTKNIPGGSSTLVPLAAKYAYEDGETVKINLTKVKKDKKTAITCIVLYLLLGVLVVSFNLFGWFSIIFGVFSFIAIIANCNLAKKLNSILKISQAAEK